MTSQSPWRRREPESTQSGGPFDQEVARLTAKADLIVEELDDVVRQMSDMLRKKYNA